MQKDKLCSLTATRKAFTLIELIIVCAIISILATIVVMNYTGAKAKSRDARRVVDINSLATAAGILYSEQKKIILCACDGKTFTVASQSLANVLVPNYLNTIPHDPKYSGSSSYDEEYVYITRASNNGTISQAKCETPFTPSAGFLPATRYWFSAKMEIDNAAYINSDQATLVLFTSVSIGGPTMTSGMRYIVSGPSL